MAMAGMTVTGVAVAVVVMGDRGTDTMGCDMIDNSMLVSNVSISL